MADNNTQISVKELKYDNTSALVEIARKALQAKADASGNIIIDTYAAKTELIHMVVVASLPETGQTNYIYFVENGESTGNNKYNEYVWIEDSTKGNFFEKVGYTDISGKVDKLTTTGIHVYTHDGTTQGELLVDSTEGGTTSSNNIITSGAVNAGLAKKVNTSDIVDNLTSTDTNKPLSANQGKVLKDTIDNLPSPMVFKGTLGEGGTITDLPEASTSTIGHTYKVITAGTYASQTAKVGDLFVCNDSPAWILVPSGDEPSGTVTNIAVGEGLLTDQSESGPITESGTISIDYDIVAKLTNINEDDLKLNNDLYTYAPIGNAQKATNEVIGSGSTISQTNRGKVASKGESLKKVFNTIFGEEQDTNPTISTSGTSLTKSDQTGTTSASGGEVGLSISSQTGTVTFTVSNTATCSYGLKAGDTDTYSKTSSTTFNYPIKTRTVTIDSVDYNYQIAINYQDLNGCTLSITAGTLVKDNYNSTSKTGVLYCNVDSNQKVTVSITMPAGTSTTSAQTRFGSMTASVQFDNAKYNNVVVNNFWTYLKSSYTSSGITPPSEKTASSTAYTITAGTYYPYYKVTTDTETPTTSLSKDTSGKCYSSGVAAGSTATYVYFYIQPGTSKSQIKYQDGSSWNNTATTSIGTKSITLSHGGTCSYTVYRTTTTLYNVTLRIE